MDLLAIAAIAFAYAPLLFLQCKAIWANELYHFVPFAVIAAGYLANLRVRSDPGLEFRFRPAFAWLLLPTAALLGAAVVIDSPWLASISAQFSLAVGILIVGGWRFFRLMLPVWMLLWITIPLPFSVENKLVMGLRQLATRLSSDVLDVFRVNHYREGNVLFIKGKTLTVEDACSGIHSLFSILATAMAWICLKRYSLVHAFFLLVAAVYWVLFGNVFRIAVASGVQEIFGISLIAGKGHDVLSFIATIMMTILVLSTDRIFGFIRLSSLYGRILSMVGVDSLLDDLKKSKEPNRSVGRWPGFSDLQAPIACSLIALVFGALAGAQGYGMMTSGKQQSTLIAKLDAAGESLLPAEMDGWKLVKSRVEGAESNSLGVTTRFWDYTSSQGGEAIGLSLPYNGWHDLAYCYEGVGWQVKNRAVEELSDPDKRGSVILIELERPIDNATALLVFQARNLFGYTIPPPSTSIFARFYQRLQAKFLTSFRRDPRFESSPAFQVQIIRFFNRPVGTEDKRTLKSDFEKLMVRFLPDNSLALGRE